MTGWRAGQRGLTLIELMVALSLGLLITLAAVAALTVARRGFTTVDAASQLRDNGRFATDLIQRVVQQAGFRDVTYAAATRSTEFHTAAAGANPEPDVKGFNNALATSAASPLTLAHDSRNAAAGGCNAGDTACVNGSDVLVLRYQSGEGIAGSGSSDGAMINCA
ncbi:MAG TPA: prepilin-type N-terminal cleavage/methylation domain-containing protein, partial [Burkholderiaceae bacterium]|nr:prepilin-type N-terminal cleavage/methylation domain-containing protein [Burkholderiaceae bacterium]